MSKLMKHPVTVHMLQILLMLLGLCVSLFIFLDQFSYPQITETVVIAGVFGTCFAIFHLLLKGKWRVLFFGAVGLLWVLIGLGNRARLLEGAQAALNQILPYLSDFFYIALSSPTTDTADALRAGTTFGVYCLIPYCMLMSWAVVVRRSAWISLVLTAPMVAVALVLREIPSAPQIVLLFTFWISMLLQTRVFAKGRVVHAGLQAGVTGLVMLGLFLFFSVFPEVDYVPSQKAFQTRDDITDLAVEVESSIRLKGLPGFSSGAPLTDSDGNINLNNTGNLRFADKDILRVYNAKKGVLYLRGYAADRYTGHEWLRSDETALASAGIDFPVLEYLAEKTGIQLAEGATETVKVELLDDKSPFLFTPYLLQAPCEVSPAPHWAGDIFLRSDGQRSYEFDIYQPDGFSGVISGIENLVWYEEEDRNSPWTIGFLREEEIEQRQNFHVTELSGEQVSFYVERAQMDFLSDLGHPIDALGQELYQSLVFDMSSMAFLEQYYPEDLQDKAYLQYIQSAYTQLPDGLQETLLGWLEANRETGSAAIDESSFFIFSGYTGQGKFLLNYQAAAIVAELVSRSGTYNTSPGPQPLNLDFVTYFLTQRKEGYCTHYASATVTLLRALGIPARYVEGYVVSPGDYNGDGWATVPADRAHAWAEVWVPDFGWIPVESTPGGSGAAANSVGEHAAEPEPPTPTAAPQQTPTPEAPLEPNVTEKPQNTPAATVEPTAPPEGQMTEAANPSPVVWLVVILAGVLLLLLLPRQVKSRVRNRRFAGRDANRAALSMYAYLERLGPYGKPPSAAAKVIRRKAQFSTHKVTAAERTQLEKEIEKALLRIRSTQPALRRMLLWWCGEI